MGCSQGKTTKPAASGTGGKPTPTLLSPTSAQKQSSKDKEAVVASVNDTEVKDGADDGTNFLKSIFSKIDADKNGHVDAKELATALREEESLAVVLEKAGLNSQWYVLEQLDLNHDGKITWDEFKTSLENAPASEKRPEALESLAVPLADSQDWPLRWKALRVFAMADKQMLLLDTKQLAGDGSDSTFAEMLRSVLGGDGAGLVSQAEWLEIVKKFALEDEVQAASFLDLCLKRLGEQKEHWKLREEALQVFSMGDRNGDGHLDMNELTELRRSAEFAQAMLDVMDIDKNGVVSKGEWLAYVKRLADENETSAAAVLKLYGKHLSSKTPVVGEAAIDVIPGQREDGRALEDSGVRATQRQRRWACC